MQVQTPVTCQPSSPTPVYSEYIKWKIEGVELDVTLREEKKKGKKKWKRERDDGLHLNLQ